MPNELHTMPLKIEKFFSSANVRMMTADEKGIYLLLLAEAWLQGAKLPADSRAIRLLLAMPSDELWQRIESKVLPMFHVWENDSSFLINDMLLEVFEEVKKTSILRRKQGKKGAEKRWHSPANGPAIAKVWLTHSNQSQTQSQTQIDKNRDKPRTFKQFTFEEFQEEVKKAAFEKNMPAPMLS